MTAISALSPYSSYSAYSAHTSSSTRSDSSTNTNTSSTATSATNVTLSASARAALATKSFLEVIDEARTKLTGLIDKAGSDGPCKDGELAIDLSSFDRRSLFAIAGNTDGTFTSDEINAALDELNGRFDNAMAGPYAVYKVTGDITKLYTAAQTWLNDASSEEKATTAWTEQSTAVASALTKLQTAPTSWPDVENDPVVDYVKRAEAGTTAETQSFSSVADNARTAIDQQITAAKAAGTWLNFSKYTNGGTKADLSDFTSRSLSAIVLNEGDQFSSEETAAAKSELSHRSSQVLLSCLSEAGKSSSFTALAENIISAYGSMSSEERQAVGWGDNFYQAALANYKSASQIASMFGNASGASTGLAGLMGGSDTNSTSGLLGLLSQ